MGDRHTEDPETARDPDTAQDLETSDWKRLAESFAVRARELGAALHWTLRFVDEAHEWLAVRNDVVQPVRLQQDRGVMVTVTDRGGQGYGATSDLSLDGLLRAAERARDWAHASAGSGVVRFAAGASPALRGEYRSPVARAWGSLSRGAKLDLLREQSTRLHADPRILEWEAALWGVRANTRILTSSGGDLRQEFSYVIPMLSASANQGNETQTRTLGAQATCQQGGLEVLDTFDFEGAAPRIAQEALELLAAPNCPSETCDVILAPDQMILQIHESIGHPLELDRILGDERNYAGTSFVTPDMFGSYQYGSPLLDVTFDPTRPEQLASYRWDDEGLPAERVFLIRAGRLERGIGGALSQERLSLPGVANSRAQSWNRPPIDRMANLNLEPGDDSFESLVARVERGVYMETNRSWSIDDSRNKFQFGCERARLIERGELGPVVKNPNYRGISANFWRSLAGVGNAESVQVLGTPFCGKGEPNQVIRVGHASPPCWFRDVEVFGGEEAS